MLLMGTRRVEVVLAAGKATGDEPSAMLAAAAPSSASAEKGSRSLVLCAASSAARRHLASAAAPHAQVGLVIGVIRGDLYRSPQKVRTNREFRGFIRYDPLSQ